MENGDIADFYIPSQACIFEHLLAAPPASVSEKLKNALYTSRGDWDAVINLWKPNEIPLKSLIDSVNRRRISTLVVTFLSPEAPEAIYRWLLRKGVTTTVEFYESPQAFAEDLRYNRSILNVFVPDKDTAHTIGFRATTASTTTLWNI